MIHTSLLSVLKFKRENNVKRPRQQNLLSVPVFTSISYCEIRIQIRKTSAIAQTVTFIAPNFCKTPKMWGVGGEPGGLPTFDVALVADGLQRGSTCQELLQLHLGLLVLRRLHADGGLHGWRAAEASRRVRQSPCPVRFTHTQSATLTPPLPGVPLLLLFLFLLLLLLLLTHGRLRNVLLDGFVRLPGLWGQQGGITRRQNERVTFRARMPGRLTWAPIASDRALYHSLMEASCSSWMSSSVPCRVFSCGSTDTSAGA